MFGKLFGNKEEKKEVVKSKINWVLLESVAQIDEVISKSQNELVGVFKHSTRCSISRTTLKRFEQNFPENANITMYYIDLLNFREVSNEVGIRFQVIHQSPQLLVIDKGNAIRHASHYDILELSLER